MLSVVKMVEAKSGLKDRMITIALKEIKRVGAHKMSLRKIAELSGVTPMATYRHFPSKEALIAEIAREGFVHLRQQMQTVSDRNDLTPIEKIEHMGHRYIHMALERPEHLLMMFGGFIDDHEQFIDMKNAGDSAFFTLVDTMSQAQGVGALPKVDPVKQAIAAWSIVHGFSMLLINGNMSFLGIDTKNYQTFSAYVSRSVLEGLKNLPPEI